MSKKWGRRLKLRKVFRSLLYVNGKIIVPAYLVLIALILTGTGLGYKYYMATYIDPARYTPLLNTIAMGESRGNYNAYFGHGDNATLRFTDMTVGDVMKWQEEYVRSGSPSSAVGKYQIVRPTLAGLVQKLHIEPSEKFDEKLQDRMAVALLERRGAEDYMKNKLSRQQFAANLAKEWAALPKVIGANPQQSYYAGDGLNKVQISIDEVYKALATIKS